MAAGFINGFAGFGTALVASGVWFLVLPPAIVPPLIILSALAGQIVGLVKLAGTMDWRKSSHLISGGLAGVPAGTALLAVLSPVLVKTAIGGFLVIYSLSQFRSRPKAAAGSHKDGFADRCVGFLGGVMGGFAGLSGPFPLIWLQMHGLSPAEQRARYQPFNLVVLGFAAAAMALIGKVDMDLLYYASVAVPFSLAGAAIGVRAFLSVSPELFHRAVLAFLLLSGGLILGQSAFG